MKDEPDKNKKNGNNHKLEMEFTLLSKPAEVSEERRGEKGGKKVNKTYIKQLR